MPRVALCAVLTVALPAAAALLVGVPPLRTMRRAHVRASAELPPKARALVAALGVDASVIDFEDTMGAIEEMYDFTAVPFSVGDVVSEAGQNLGSLKIFSFAKKANLDEAATLQLFGRYYRDDVRGAPDGTDHANIRAFMKGGWACVKLPEPALRAKGTLA